MADHACECCRIALAKGSDGRLRALWRHVFPPNVRDHAFALIADGQPANAYTRATYDGWRVDGCPHHGPSLAADDAQGFHTVWFGLREENGQTVPGVRYARLRPDDQPDPATVQRLPISIGFPFRRSLLKTLPTVVAVVVTLSVVVRV